MPSAPAAASSGDGEEKLKLRVKLYRQAVAFRNRRPWVPAAIAVVATAGASLDSIFIVTPEGDIRWWPLVTAVALILLASAITIGLEVTRAAAERRERSEKVQLQVTIGDAIIPIAEELATMPASTSDARQISFNRIVGYASHAAGLLLPEAKRLRAVVYLLEPARGQRKRHLKAGRPVGRPDKARNFTDGDGGRGTTAFKWLFDDDEGTMFVDDLKQKRSPGWQGTGRGYLTFISAKMKVDGEPVGMFTVDAPRPGDLDEADKVLIEVLAGLIAIAHAESRK